MKILIYFVFFYLITCTISAQLRPEYMDNSKTKIYLDNVVLGFGVDTTLLTADKIKPALNYVTSLLSDSYELAQDAEVLAARSKLNNPTAFDIAKECQADKIFVIQVEQLWNIVRIEIIAADTKLPDTTISGKGLAVLHIFKKSDGMPVFDPTILTALQRAFADCMKDSLMFMKESPPYNVKPAPSIVIAGIEFINDKNYENWDVFNSPVVTSYEYIELIYNEIHKTSDWIVFDISSRDAIYSQFNLFLIENNISPSYNELAALRRFEVEYYIIGRIQRNGNGLAITLELRDNKITQNGTFSNQIINSVSENIYKNDIPITQNIIKELANKLIFDNQIPQD